MASKSHGPDLDHILPAITSILRARPHVRFEVFGTLSLPPFLSTLFPRRVRSRPAVIDYTDFLRHLASTKWAVGLAPLLPTEFNTCKSAIKYLEYTLCGIPIVASDTIPYRVIDSELNGLLARSPDEWVAHISRLLDDRTFAAELVARARQACEAMFGLKAEKARLLTLLCRLAGVT
ncbi:MAG TPA: glycosyltransferase [Nitrospiraceae bacterium]|nr:glycosyltransferase [Nitrospiraceae bacterium]